MRVKILNECHRCKEFMILNDIRVEEDLIVAEYICDCSNIQKNILDEIVYCKSDEHRYN